MKLPSKEIAIRESVIFKMTIILDALTDSPAEPESLYNLLHDSFSDTSEFIDCLDCLYILRKIWADEEGLIHAA